MSENGFIRVHKQHDSDLTFLTGLTDQLLCISSRILEPKHLTPWRQFWHSKIETSTPSAHHLHWFGVLPVSWHEHQVELMMRECLPDIRLC